MADVAVGEFYIQSFDPSHYFTAELGDAAPLPDSDSYGGWGVTAIPKRMGLTEWAGRNPMGVALDFIIDRLNSGEDGAGIYVAGQRDELEKIAGTGSREDEPPACIVNTGGVMPNDYVHASHVRWIIESIDWDKALTVNSAASGRPVRIGGTIHLRQYNHDDLLDAYKGPASKNKDKNKKGKNKSKTTTAKTYRVKAGDTLHSIAARTLGSSTKWKEIADLNNIRNSRSLKINQVLKLP
jgi:LysM repeat protein